jgi:hypothetical protein
MATGWWESRPVRSKPAACCSAVQRQAAYAARAFADAEAARLLSDADPLRGSATEALMSDEAWLALQAICEPAASSGG